VVHNTRLINPLLDCELSSPSGLATHKALEHEITAKIATATAAGDVTHVSVYFRGLNDGPWIGIAQNAEYAPASMMKVPVMLAAFRKAEDDPAFLDRQILYDELFGYSVRTAYNDVQIELGETYSVRDLIERMIRHSDNEAAFILMREVTPDLTSMVMREVGVVAPARQMDGDFVSVREYASVFRLLYNATYLNRDMSETALNILTQTNFKGGLRARIPQGIVVAHKFGERIIPDSPVRQLHDCGIIYHPYSPYILCVMTRGHDMKKLASVIADISASTYTAVSHSTPDSDR
jgi:beta-lactamase class A